MRRASLPHSEPRPNYPLSPLEHCLEGDIPWLAPTCQGSLISHQVHLFSLQDLPRMCDHRQALMQTGWSSRPSLRWGLVQEVCGVCPQDEHLWVGEAGWAASTADLSPTRGSSDLSPTGVSARKGSGSSYPLPGQYGGHRYHPQALRRWINAVTYLSEWACGSEEASGTHTHHRPPVRLSHRVKLELFIVSGAKQSDSVISIFLRFSSIIGYYTILSKFSWAIQ